MLVIYYSFLHLRVILITLIVTNPWTKNHSAKQGSWNVDRALTKMNNVSHPLTSIFFATHVCETSLLYFLLFDKFDRWKFFSVYMEETKNCWYCVTSVERTISVIRMDPLNKWRLNFITKYVYIPSLTFMWRNLCMETWLQG